MVKGNHRAGGPKPGCRQIDKDRGEKRQREYGRGRQAGEREGNKAAAEPSDFDQRIALNEVVDRGRMRVDAGRRIAGKEGRCFWHRQRAARTSGIFRRGRKTLGGDLAIFHVKRRADNHDFAGEIAAEEFLVALFDTGAQISERVGRNPVGAAVEIKRHGIRDFGGDPIPDKSHCTVGGNHGGAAELACRKLDRHRRLAVAVDNDGERNAPHHVVRIAINVQRSDIGTLPNGEALTWSGPDREVPMLRLTQHDFPRACSEGKRAQEIAVKAAQPCPERAVAKRDFGLFDGRRKYDVKAHDFGAAGEDRGQDLPELPRPSDRGRACKRRRAISLLVERDHNRGRRLRIVDTAKDMPAQRGEYIDREAAKLLERGRQADERCAQCDYDGGTRIAKTCRWPHHSKLPPS